MNTYQVEFMSRSNRNLIIKTMVEGSSVDKVESCACQWLEYWMGLKSTEFKISVDREWEGFHG
jgi:hypothetical protein